MSEERELRRLLYSTVAVSRSKSRAESSTQGREGERWRVSEGQEMDKLGKKAGLGWDGRAGAGAGAGDGDGAGSWELGAGGGYGLSTVHRRTATAKTASVQDQTSQKQKTGHIPKADIDSVNHWHVPGTREYCSLIR